MHFKFGLRYLGDKGSGEQIALFRIRLGASADSKFKPPAVGLRVYAGNDRTNMLPRNSHANGPPILFIQGQHWAELVSSLAHSPYGSKNIMCARVINNASSTDSSIELLENWFNQC
jgi:hypothetical protein